jgi:hypothetical protein
MSEPQQRDHILMLVVRKLDIELLPGSGFAKH